MKSLDFKVLTNLVDAKPFADAYTMVNMIAWQFDLSSPSFVPRLANYTPAFPNKYYSWSNTKRLQNTDKDSPASPAF